MVQSIYNTSQNIGTLSQSSGGTEIPVSTKPLTFVSAALSTILQAKYGGPYTIMLQPKYAGYPGIKCDLYKKTESDIVQINNVSGINTLVPADCFKLTWDDNDYIKIGLNNTDYAGQYQITIYG